MQYQGREFLLEVDNGTVTLKHNSLLNHSSGLQSEQQRQLAEDNLQLDEHGMITECGLEDLLKLLGEWQQFLAD
jgi:hypothetical protein